MLNTAREKEIVEHEGNSDIKHSGDPWNIPK